MPERNKIFTMEEEFENLDQVLYSQRNENMRQLDQSNLNLSALNKLPSILKRHFEVYILRGPGAKNSLTPIRQLKAKKIGHLVAVRCIVVRVSDVKPLIQIACYACDSCGYEIYQTVNS